MKNRRHLLRIFFLLLWAALFGALLQRDYFVEQLDLREARVLQRGREESFLGVYFRDERIGFVKNRLRETGLGTLELEQNAELLLNILNDTHPVRMAVTAHLSPELLLRDFSFSFSSPFYKMAADGTVEGRTVRFTLTTGKTTIEDQIELASPPYLALNQRSYLLRPDLAPGDKLKIPYFDPFSLSGKDTVVEYKGRKKELILGRIHELHQFVETFSGIRVTFWLDDQGRVVKEESPAGFVFLAEPEFRATAISGRGSEILSAVSVKARGEVAGLAGSAAASYRITLPEDAEFELSGDRQHFADGVLRVQREELPPPASPVCPGDEADLASTPYIQAKNGRITALAAEITAGIEQPMEKLRRLAAWVHDNLEKRPVLGIPDALTTLDNRAGDCNEHAALFAALARNQGIPTRVAAGVTLIDDAFYYHAWNEVCLGGRWLSVDTTTNQLPADVGHIKFLNGETEEQVKIGALLGKLQIEVLPAPHPPELTP